MTVTSARAIALVAGGARARARGRPRAISSTSTSTSATTNLPAGRRLAVGEAVLEVSEAPHTGCGKYVRRFGVDAMKFVNSKVGRSLRLRGLQRPRHHPRDGPPRRPRAQARLNRRIGVVRVHTLGGWRPRPPVRGRLRAHRPPPRASARRHTRAATLDAVKRPVLPRGTRSPRGRLQADHDGRRDGGQRQAARRRDRRATQASFGLCQGSVSRTSSASARPSIGTRRCSRESRSRRVTVSSSAVCPSTVTPHGVPISSWRR